MWLLAVPHAYSVGHPRGRNESDSILSERQQILWLWRGIHSIRAGSVWPWVPSNDVCSSFSSAAQRFWIACRSVSVCFALLCASNSCDLVSARCFRRSRVILCVFASNSADSFTLTDDNRSVVSTNFRSKCSFSLWNSSWVLVSSASGRYTCGWWNILQGTLHDEYQQDTCPFQQHSSPM